MLSNYSYQDEECGILYFDKNLFDKVNFLESKLSQHIESEFSPESRYFFSEFIFKNTKTNKGNEGVYDTHC